MGYNFKECNREQLFLLPVSMREWLPEGNLARFILDAVEEMDLAAFYRKYREDGWGRAAYEPRMMVALLLYAYCLGIRSSREIERACEDRASFRAITANQRPHTTIARFRQEFTEEIGKLFTEALRLCVRAGLVKVGVVALDGTKVAENASLSANRTYEHLERKEFSPDRLRKGGELAIADVARQYGKLPVLLVRMNADLSLGEQFLKRTGAGNLFMVFGEPDVEVRRADDGKVVVEIQGVDVYDPTTGQIRSHTTDDIACWFVDTNYDGESFFVRHAYFTGADEPYEKLKRALKAEIDEAAWATLYSTVTRPFDPPATGRIAIKVINHYGDEVLKVYEVQP